MKKKPLKILMHAFAILFAFAFTNDSFSQSSNDDWVLLKDSIQVKFYYKTVLCDNHETVLYKISSSNSAEVNLNWTAWGGGTGEMISIEPNAEKEGSCSMINKLTTAIPLGAAVINNKLPIVFTVFN